MPTWTLKDLRLGALQAILIVAGILIQTGSAAGQSLLAADDGASRWVTIDVVEFGAVDLDVSSVAVTAPGVYQVRTRWRFASVQTSSEGLPYESSIAVRGIDCGRGEIALISYANHDGAKVVDAGAVPSYGARWEPVTPRSVVSRITDHVCGSARSGAIAATDPSRNR